MIPGLSSDSPQNHCFHEGGDTLLTGRVELQASASTRLADV